MRNEIGLRIATLREARGLSQKQLADALNVKRETVTQWENATRDLKTDYLINLSAFFNVSVDYLLCLSNAQTRNETIQGIHNETGLWQDAITALMTEKRIDDYAISEFISYLITNERLPHLINAIRQKNSFSDGAICRIDIDGEDHKTNMKSLFKLVINDLFWEIIDGYTVEHGQMMIGRTEGKCNG